jgi:hypothetical protein
MTTHRSHTADWNGTLDTQDWTSRFGDAARKLVDAMSAGREAEHDYRKLAARGLAPQQVNSAVFSKHFAKR